MYIIELIAKLLKKKDKTLSISDDTDTEEKCEHVFLPIDSTGEIFACSKCGYVVKKDEVSFKPKNPFV